MRRHTAASRHIRSLSRDLSVVDIFGRVDGRFAVNTILVASARFRRVEAGLQFVQQCVMMISTWSATYLDKILALGFCHQWL